MGAARAQQSETIAAPPQACFDALTAFETYPEWVTAVHSCTVLERDADGRGELVETVIDAKLRRVRYVLRYHYAEPGRIWWDYVEGDVRSVEGEYLLEDAGEGCTRATYALAIDPGVFVPGPIRRLLTDGVMRGSVRQLKERVERT